MADINVLSLLNPLVWREIEVPCQENDLSFEQGQVEHYQHGVDGATVENTGRKSARFSFRIPFRAGVAQYPDLYPTRFRDFYNACADGSTGSLSHPEFGEIDAKVVSFKVATDPNRRDGYDVDVVWVETVENGLTITDNPIGPVDYAISLGADLEDISSSMGLELPEDDNWKTLGQITSGVRSKLAQLKGKLMLADLSIADALGNITNVINDVNDGIDTANSLTDPSSWATLDALKGIESAMQETKQKLSPKAKKIDYVIAPREIAVADAAAAGGMKLDDFLRLNPRLAKSKTIAAGKEYFLVRG